MMDEFHHSKKTAENLIGDENKSESGDSGGEDKDGDRDGDKDRRRGYS